jgi:hypothetical protein
VSISPPVITSVRFQPPVAFSEEFDWLPGGRRTVHATFDDDSSGDLFSFYTDELRVIETDFLGLTERQARTLMHATDIAYLQS